MTKIPVIIDCDPGHDDMMALVLAYGSKKLDIRAVTTVAGNNTIENTTRNALNILHYIGADEIPVAKGYQDPMVRSHKEVMERMAAARRKPPVTEEERRKQEADKKIVGASVHGVSGMDGFAFPEHNPKKPEPVRSVEMMAKVLRESNEPVTIISTGPLTNLGFLLRVFPDLKEKIAGISMMGGTSEFVLTRPYMEFNTFVDPEATKIVFESGVPITMFGYDVTYRVMYDRKTIQAMRDLGNHAGTMVADLLEYFMEAHNGALKRLHLDGIAPVHDACAVAGVIAPELITESRMLHVDVETGGTYFDGATVCDYTEALGLPPNANVVYQMDNQKFLELLLQAASACQ